MHREVHLSVSFRCVAFGHFGLGAPFIELPGKFLALIKKANTDDDDRVYLSACLPVSQHSTSWYEIGPNGRNIPSSPLPATSFSTVWGCLSTLNKFADLPFEHPHAMTSKVNILVQVSCSACLVKDPPRASRKRAVAVYTEMANEPFTGCSSSFFFISQYMLLELYFATHLSWCTLWILSTYICLKSNSFIKYQQRKLSHFCHYLWALTSSSN